MVNKVAGVGFGLLEGGTERTAQCNRTLMRPMPMLAVSAMIREGFATVVTLLQRKNLPGGIEELGRCDALLKG